MSDTSPPDFVMAVTSQRETVSERLYRTLGEAVPDFIWANSADGKGIFVNQRWTEYTGLTLEAATQVSANALYHPEDYSQLVEIWTTGRIKKEAFTAEFRFRRHDGVYRWFIVRAVPILDAQGEIVEWIGTMTDIHERKTAEQALKEREALYHQLADAMPQIVWTAQPDGVVDYYNERWYEFTGFPKDGRIGDQSWLPILHPDDAQRCLDIWYNAVRTGEPYQIEYRFKDRHTGGYRWFLGRALPVRNEQGEITKWVGTCTDIDSQKQAEIEIASLNIRLQRSVQETHHRVKNNLQIISSLVELQTDVQEPTVPKAAMQRIGQHTRSLAALHDLLTHEVKFNGNADSITTQAAMDKLLPLLQTTAGERGIFAQIDDVRLPVREGASLALLVSEMVSNAVKHGRGNIELVLRVLEDRVRLEVCDDGPGFPAGFDAETAGNTGLGLIDSTGRHDLRGTISYENRPQGGARVVVTFPIPSLQY